MKFNNFISKSYLTILIVVIAILVKPNACFTQGFYGMVKVDKNLWVDDSEITNVEYRQFINYIKDSIARRKLFDNGFKEFGTKYLGKNGNDSIKLNFKTHLDWNAEKYFDIIDSLYSPPGRKAFYYQLGFDSKKINYSYYSLVDSKQIVVNCYPDTTVWESFKNNFVFQLYNWHVAYDLYPVIGISYNQAIAFCHWRTKMLNDFNASSHKKATKRVVKFTLPTLEQWNSISRMGNLGGKFNGTITDTLKPTNISEQKFLKENGYLINSKYSKDYLFDVYKTFPVQLKDGSKDDKIYGLASNAAEMTLDKYVVGGSWYHAAIKALIGETINYNCDIPAPWLGFRCVVYYIE